jgi:protein TonB
MILRILLAGVLGIAVTFGLLLLMQQLIATGNRTLDESETMHFVDFVRVPEEETTRTKDRKPEKPPPADEPPPPAQEPQQRMEADVTTEGVSFDVSRFDTGQTVNAGLGLTVADGDYLPIVKVAPVYPRRAQTRGIEGYVVLEFTVSKSGRVTDPRVIEAEPPNMFNQAAIDAVKKFKYKPRIVNGEPIEVPGVKHRITFRLEE